MHQEFFSPNKFSLKTFSIKKIVNIFHYRNELQRDSEKTLVFVHKLKSTKEIEIMIPDLEITSLLFGEDKTLSTVLSC